MEVSRDQLKLGSQDDQHPPKSQRGGVEERILHKRKAEVRVMTPHAKEHVRPPAAARGWEGKLGNSEKLVLVNKKVFPLVGFLSGQLWDMQTFSN